MTLQEIRDILQADVLISDCDMGINIECVFCADLMSDVLAFTTTESLLITGLTNAQVVHTANVATIKAIVFVQNKRPNKETVELAEGKRIPLLSTSLSMFDVCGKLYMKGLHGVPNAEQK